MAKTCIAPVEVLAEQMQKAYGRSHGILGGKMTILVAKASRGPRSLPLRRQTRTVHKIETSFQRVDLLSVPRPSVHMTR